MSPGIGLMKRRLEKEKDAVSLAISGIAKKYNTKTDQIKTLETKYDENAGDWMLHLAGMKKRQLSRWTLFRELTEIKEI